jgi:DNA-binding NarL/FixJ family response regulator
MATIKRIAVCDPHDISRNGIVAIVNGNTGNHARPVSLESVLRADSETRSCDLLMFDLVNDDERLLVRSLGKIRRARSDLRLLLVTAHRAARFLSAALDNGVHGCVLKGEDGDELLHALEIVSGGENYVSPGATDVVLAQRRFAGERRLGAPGREVQLTAREYQVMCQIARGLRTRDIARSLNLSVKTIEKYRGTLRSKVGARGVASITAFAIAHAGLDPTELVRPARRLQGR